MSFFEELKRRNVIRVGIAYVAIAWLIAQVAGLALDTFNAPDWVMQTILIMLALGLPLAVFFAWAFEVTPEGIKKEKDVDRGQSITPRTRRKFDVAILGVMSVALTYFVADKFWLRSGAIDGPQQAETIARDQTERQQPLDSDISPRSVAVLPFAHRSAQADDQYFTDGMHDDLLTQLAKIGDLTVISRTSMMRYRDTDKPIPEIARELGVATILEGGVQRAGKRIRINAQLIEAATDRHLWSEIYDREMTVENLFDIQSEITREIVNAVQGNLSGAEREALEQMPTDNLDAYQAYLLGQRMSVFVGATLPRLEAAIESFEQAIGLDPGFAEAHAALAYTHLLAYWSHGKDKKFRDAAATALNEAHRFAPNSVATLKSQGFYYYWGYLNYDEALQAFDRALQLSPGSADIWAGKAYVERRAGLFQSALSSLQKALRLDPGNAEYTFNVAYTAIHTGDFELANRVGDQLRLLTESTVYLLANESVRWWIQGNCEKAWAAVSANIPDAPIWYHTTRLPAAICMRDKSNIQQVLDHWDNDQENLTLTPYLNELFRAEALLAMGRQEEGRALLDHVQSEADRSDSSYSEDWLSNLSNWPFTLAMLRRDVDGIHRAVKAFENKLNRDQFLELPVIPTVASAYARAGETGLALDYLERHRDMPWLFAQVTIDPNFDSIREHPRYLALKTGYETWKVVSQE